MTLKELELGKTGIIISVGGDGSLRQHFLDMGVIPGVKVTKTKYLKGEDYERRSNGKCCYGRKNSSKEI